MGTGTEEKDCMACYSYSEGRTRTNQLIEFSCHPDNVEKVRSFLSENIRHIDIPTTGQVNVAHGGYGKYTRYDIIQHDYAGGGYPGCGGFREVLEIKNPPDGRCGIVVYEEVSGKGSFFIEWETLKDARSFFSKHQAPAAEELKKISGFKRRVNCGALTPWFYAIGDEQLIGDYAFPEGIQDDPVFRFGKQFVVFDKDDIPAVKTCMGTRFIQGKKIGYYDQTELHYRLVYWDDGSVWDESEHKCGRPRPIEEGEAWITEAVAQFRQLLAGKSTEFAINFIDGNKFIGRLAQKKPRSKSAEGNYFLVVRLKGKNEPVQGRIEFKPTRKAPDIVRFVTQRFAEKGQEVEFIEVKECKTEKGGKKWIGAFF